MPMRVIHPTVRSQAHGSARHETSERQNGPNPGQRAAQNNNFRKIKDRRRDAGPFPCATGGAVAT